MKGEKMGEYTGRLGVISIGNVDVPVTDWRLSLAIESDSVGVPHGTCHVSLTDNVMLIVGDGMDKLVSVKLDTDSTSNNYCRFPATLKTIAPDEITFTIAGAITFHDNDRVLA